MKIACAQLILLVGVVPCLAGLRDPGFEQPAARVWLGPWSGGSGGGQGAGLVVRAGEADFAYGSERAMRLSVWSENTGGVAWAGVTQVYPCEPGRTVDATAWVYHSSSNQPLREGTKVQLKIEYCEDPDGARLIPDAVSEGPALSPSPEFPPDGWCFLASQDVAPEGARALRLSIALIGEGLDPRRQSVWVDDVSLEVEGVEFRDARFAEDGTWMPTPLAEPAVKLSGGRFALDGEEFWIKGVGYSPYRPGSPPNPGTLQPEEALREDMRRIKAAGFNTLRLWDDAPDRLYELAAEAGLCVLSGVSFPLGDLKTEEAREFAVEWARGTIGRLRSHPNIIGYLMINEPELDLIEDTGAETLRAFFKSLVDAAHEMDPHRPVATTPWIVMWFLNTPAWDMLCYNLYGYYPSVVTTNLGYARFVEHVRRAQAGSRPFIVTEFGYPVNPSGAGGLTYGGNTPEEQARGVVQVMDELVAGGAQGGCVFEWNDEWWKQNNTPDDAQTHDDDPEEYFGLVSFEHRGDIIGTPRPAYYALQKYFANLVLSPRNGAAYAEDVDIRVYRPAADDPTAYEYALDGGRWRPLAAEGLWATGRLAHWRLRRGLHTLKVRALGPDGNVREDLTRTISFGAVRSGDRPQHRIRLIAQPTQPQPGEPLRLSVLVTGAQGAPAAGHPVRLSLLQVRPVADTFYEGQTDGEGMFEAIYLPPRGGKNSHVTLWASCDTTCGGVPAHAAADLSVLMKASRPRGPGWPALGIPRAAAPPQIDGERDAAYEAAAPVALSVPARGPVEVLVQGRWRGNDDLSARVRCLWDDAGLYLLAEVRDATPAQNAWAHAEIWRGDGMEVYLGTDPAAAGEAYEPTDYQFVLAPAAKTWVYGQAAGGTRNSPLKDAELVTLSTPGGYAMEARIPWANFGFQPAAGSHLRMEFVLNNFVEGQGMPSRVLWASSGEACRWPKEWGFAGLLAAPRPETAARPGAEPLETPE